MSTPMQPAPPPREQQRSPWGVVLLALVALALGVAGGVLIANSGDEETQTVTRAKTVTTSNSTDVTVSVPTTTTTVEKTVTVTRQPTATTDTASP
jgi:hypothetical protein